MTQTLNIDYDFHKSSNNAAKKCGLSRDQIVDKMNYLSDNNGIRLTKGNSHHLTVATIEKWLNPNDGSHPMPLKAVPVFCAAVKNNKPIDAIARPLGLQVIGDQEQKLLEWARAYHEKRRAAHEMRSIERELTGIKKE